MSAISHFHMGVLAARAGDIIAWANARNIIKGGTPQSQFVKLVEEYGELDTSIAGESRTDVVDALGDCFVVLTILSAQYRLSIDELIGAAQDFNVINQWDFPLPDLGKLAGAIARGNETEIGTSIVALMAGLMYGAKEWSEGLHQCVEDAYDEIKDRRGVMYQGTFVKSTDARYQDICAELGIPREAW